MNNIRRQVVRGILASGLLFGALAPAGMAQGYLYNQASFATGGNPSAIAIGDFNGDGRLDLAIANYIDGTVSVLLSQPDGTYAPKVDYATGGDSMAIASGDFNGDGKLDLAVANGDGTVSILLGVGDGTFMSQQPITSTGGGSAIAVADFNGDGKLDLAVGSGGNVYVLFGNGDGTFGSPVASTVPAQPSSLVVGDVNNDGYPDLVVLSTTNQSTGTVMVLLNNGKGTLAAQPPVLQGLLVGMAVGDFNNDGNLDIAIINSSLVAVVLELGNGAGGFTSSVVDLTNKIESPPYGIIAADFNGDGNMDLALLWAGSPLNVLLGNGDGTFHAPVSGPLPFTYPPTPVSAADFNNDGVTDLVAVLPPLSTAVIMIGNGDGTFASWTDSSLPLDSEMGDPVVGDFNGDGKLDLVIPEYNSAQTGPVQGFLSFLAGKGDGSFQDAVPSSSSDMGVQTALTGDFNGDGHLDVVTLDVDNNGGLAVFMGHGDGTFDPPVVSGECICNSGINPASLAAGDFNEDGKTDLIFISSTPDNNDLIPLGLLTSKGDGTFQDSFIYDLQSAQGVVVTGDFNGDGHLDLAVVDGFDLYVFLGNGDGTFQSPTHFLPGISAEGVVVGDFNGDGNLDILVGENSGLGNGTTVFYAGNGDGTFQPPVTGSSAVFYETMTVGDFNHDGILDLAVTGFEAAITVELGNGDGSFQTPSTFGGTYGITGTTAGDFNSDGAFDPVLPGFLKSMGGSTDSAGVTVYRSTPTPVFSSASLNFGSGTVGMSSAPQSITLSNAGNAAFSIAHIAAQGDFSETHTCANTLAIGQSCAISVTFTPTANGLRTGSLTFTDNGRPGTQTLVLSGWAGPADFVVSAKPSSRSVAPGGRTTYIATLTPGGGFQGAVQVSCTGAPRESTCSPSPSSVILNGSNPVNLQVNVATMAPSFLPLTTPVDLPPVVFAKWLALVFLLLLLLCLLDFRPKRTSAPVSRAAVILAILLGVACFGCGGGSSGGTTPPSGSGGTPAGSYTLTVSATSGNLNHTATVSLTVQ